MNVDVDFIGEIWLTVKEYIPSKERQAVADHLVSIIADYNASERDLKTLASTDSYLGRAIAEHLDDDEDLESNFIDDDE